MPGEFEVDVSPIVHYVEDLVLRYGVAKAGRIVECQRPHYAEISCVCGWLDDGAIPDPIVVAGTK